MNGTDCQKDNMQIPIIEENINKGYKITGLVETEEPKMDFIIDRFKFIKSPEKIKTTHKEWISIFPEAIPYLEEDLDLQLKNIDELTIVYNQESDKVDKLKEENSKEFWQSVVDYFIGGEITKSEKRIKEIDRYLQIISGIPVEGRITREDIERAKEYPFDQLIDFKNNFALCPFHNEKTPSLHWNKNKNEVHCFGCNKSWDTIAFLRETQGLSFQQAVNILK
jgi:hypothetical protein